MTGSEARKGKQALASVSPLGNRQIGFHYAVCLFLSYILQLFLSSSCISLHLSSNSKIIIHAFPCSCSAALFLLLVLFVLPLFLYLSFFLSLLAHHFISQSWAVSWAELHRRWLLPDMNKNSPSVAARDVSKFIHPNQGGCCVYLWVRWLWKGPELVCQGEKEGAALQTLSDSHSSVAYFPNAHTV